MGTDAAIDIVARIGGATTDAASRVTGAIRDAARMTGAGFEYLLNTALRESNLNPNAKARTSSATGLFQFIDQTWLGTMKQSGTALGYGKYANAITRTPQGRFVVSDPAMRNEIMALRKDPTANAVMAGAFANSNAKVLTDRLGRKPTDGELYIAHVLGASGAARFIRAAEAQPGAAAASYFPRAAQANGSIFYDKRGGARSLKQVYAGLVAKHDVIGATRLAAIKSPHAVKPTEAATSAKAVIPTVSVVPTVSVAPPVTTPAINVASAPAVAHVAAVAPVSAAAPPATARAPAATPEVQAVAYASEPRQAPMFQSLYHSDDRGPVAPVVRQLWGARPVASADTASAVTQPAAASGSGAADTRLNAPLDLFRFLRPTARRPA